MRSKLPITVTGSIAVAAIAGSALLLRPQGTVPTAFAQSPTPSSAPPVVVQSTHAKQRDVSRFISLPGDVHPWAETTLYAKVPGYLGTISVDKGDRVQAGQLLATIQAPELQADREQAQQTYQSTLASVQGSRASQESAAAEEERARLAVEKATADYQQAPAGVARAKAQLLQTQGAVHQADAQRQQAQAGLEESQSQVQKAQADLASAQAEQRLADITFERYQGIYAKNPMLIARQEVDTAEEHAKAARSKVAGAQSTVQSAQAHVRSAQALIAAATSQIEQAQAQVTAAQEQVNIAQAQQTSLQKQVAVATQEVAIRSAQRAVSEAKTQEIQFQAGAGRSAASKLASIADYASIRAPFNGTIVKRFVDPGAFIQSASTSQNAAAILTVADLSSLRLYINVPELEAHFIHVGTAVKVTTAGLPDANPLSGKVARTDGALDTKTRTLQVEVDLQNPGGQILPGTYATVKTVLETHPGVISVPSLAVGADKSGKFVFTVENGKAKRVMVTPGFDDGTYTEIQAGLHGTEELVVTGRDALTPNAPVRTTEWVLPTTPAKK